VQIDDAVSYISCCAATNNRKKQKIIHIIILNSIQHASRSTKIMVDIKNLASSILKSYLCSSKNCYCQQAIALLKREREREKGTIYQFDFD